MSLLRDVRSSAWAPTAASPVALFLHGFGSNEHDLAGLSDAIGVAPWAALRAPLELGGGAAAWFEITTPGNPDAAPVEAATDAIWEWVDANVDPAGQVIPIGFSQGGLMASQLLRTRPDRVRAAVVLGGFVLGAVQPADDDLAATRPPVFWGRGSADRVIATSAIERTSAWLPEHATLVERIYPGLGHAIDQNVLADVRAFLTSYEGAGA